MSLAAHQRTLLGLVRGTYEVGPHDDAYFRRVARSADLEEARGNILYWRLFVLERTCVLTVALLKRRDALVPALQAFMRDCNISPFREFQPLAFLEWLHEHPDPLLVSVARFELALARVREGDGARYVVDWPREPRAVLLALAQDDQLDESTPERPYATVISGALPYLFETVPLSAE